MKSFSFTDPNVRRILFRLLALIATAIGGGVGYDIFTGETQTDDAPPAIERPAEEPPAPQRPATPAPQRPATPAPQRPAPAPQKAAKPSERARCVFASFRDGQWVTGWGRVKKLLPDDTYAPCHQRFLLVDPTGETLLIAHNIDKWPRLNGLSVGDVVEFKGEFKDTDRGYLVHWTHPDPAGRRPGGYIRKGR